jgi:hypothetical protein
MMVGDDGIGILEQRRIMSYINNQAKIDSALISLHTRRVWIQIHNL